MWARFNSARGKHDERAEKVWFLMRGQRLDGVDKFLLCISVIGAAIFGYSLIDDQFLLAKFVHAQSGEVEIGQISKVSNDVRRRLFRSLSWYGTGTNAKLYEKDSLYTGDNSVAEFMLQQKHKLKLDANSLVVLSVVGGEAMLDLQLGDFTAETKSGEPLMILQDGQATEVSTNPVGKPIRVSRSRAGSLDFKSQAGGEVLRFRGKQKLEDNAPAKIPLVKMQPEEIIKPVAAKQPVEPALLTPQELMKAPAVAGNDQIALAEPKKHVTLTEKKFADSREPANVYDRLAVKPVLRFQSEVDADFYQVEIASSREFKDSVVIDADKEQDAVIWDTPSPGDYFYRVHAYSQNPKHLVSAIGEMKVRLPKLNLTPEVSETIEVEDPGQLDLVDHDFDFKWSKHSLADAYAFSVLDEERKVIYRKVVTTPEFHYRLKNPGSYVARVIPLIEGVPAGPIDEVPLRYEKKLITRVPASVYPQADTTFVVFDPQAGSPVMFEWGKVPFAVGYELQMAEAPDFASPLKSIATERTKVLLRKMQGSGRLYWRIRTKYREDLFSEWSEVKYIDRQLVNKSR